MLTKRAKKAGKYSFGQNNISRMLYIRGSGKSQNEHQPQNLQRVHQVSGFIFRIQNGDTALL